MRSYKPIENVEEAFAYLAMKEGRIDFYVANPGFKGVVARVKIRGEDDKFWQNQRVLSPAEIANARYDLFTQNIIQLAERIRESENAVEVEFEKPEVGR